MKMGSIIEMMKIKIGSIIHMDAVSVTPVQAGIDIADKASTCCENKSTCCEGDSN